MRRLLFAVVAVGVMSVAGLSFAQDKESPQMPEKVREFLDNMTGSWNVESIWDGEAEMTGGIETDWDARKNTLIGNGEFLFGDASGSWSSILHWDAKSEDGVILSWSGSSTEGFEYGKIHGKVLSPTVMEGKQENFIAGMKVTANVRVRIHGPHKYTWQRTNRVANGEKKPDETDVHTRVKPTTRDEQELIKLQHEWSRATNKRDAVALGCLLADDYALTTSEGTFLTRAQMLSEMQADDFAITSLAIETLKIQIYGNMAVVKGIVRWSDGSDKSNENLFTDAWLKRDGQWRCITTHESEMAKAKSDTPKLSPEMEKLKGLVGDWAYEGEQADQPVAGLPYGGAGKYFGTYADRFILNGSFLERRIEDNNPSGKTSIVGLTGYDAKAGKYTGNAFISDGSNSVSTSTVHGRTLTNDSTMTTSEGKKVLVRSVEKYSSDWSSYVSTTEASPDNGKTWKLWYKEQGKKVDKKDTSLNTKVVYELTQLDKKLWKALMGCDIDTLDRLYAEEFIGIYNIDRNGSMWTKDVALASVRSGKSVVYSYTYDEFNVHITGDWAAITGTVSVKEKFDGKVLDDKHRFTSMWVRKSTGWKCVSENYAVISDSL